MLKIKRTRNHFGSNNITMATNVRYDDVMCDAAFPVEEDTLGFLVVSSSFLSLSFSVDLRIDSEVLIDFRVGVAGVGDSAGSCSRQSGL